MKKGVLIRVFLVLFILYYKIQSVCVYACLSVSFSWSGIGSKTMRTTVMKLLQVTQWV